MPSELLYTRILQKSDGDATTDTVKDAFAKVNDNNQLIKIMIEDHEGRIGASAGGVAARMDAAEITIAEHETRIDAAEATVTGHTSSIATNTTGVASLNEKLYWTGATVSLKPRLGGETNDDGRMSRAIAEANAMTSYATIRLRANDTLLLTKTVNIDAGKYGIVGQMSFMDFTGLTDAVAVNVYSVLGANDSADYNSLYKNNNVALSGVAIIGSWSQFAPAVGKTGLLLGHASHWWSAFWLIEAVSIQGFGTGGNLKFGSNVWRVSLDRIQSRWGKNIIPTGLTNFGENLHITRSSFFDVGTGCDFEIGSGTANFQYCSFDNCNIIANGDTTIYLNQCHLERPNSTASISHRVAVTHKDAAVFMDNCLIVPPGTIVTAFRDSMFYVTPEAEHNGLVISNTKFFEVDNFKPYAAYYAPSEYDYTRGGNIVLTVTGVVVAPSIGKRYTVTDSLGSNPWEVENVSAIVDGKGYIYLKRVNAGKYVPAASGTVTQVDATGSGDATITYTKVKALIIARNQAMVDGGGRVQINGIATWDNSNNYVMSGYLNALYNGDAETGDTTGWTSAGTGTFAAVDVPAWATLPSAGIPGDSTAVPPVTQVDPDVRYGKNFGTKSFKLEAASGQTAEAYQEFRVSPGQYVMAQYWRKTNIVGTGQLSMEMFFYSRSGAQLSATNFSAVTSTSDWNIRHTATMSVAPKGAEYARIKFKAIGTGGTTQGWFDDVIVNVV